MFNALSHLSKKTIYFLENFPLLLMTLDGCGLTGYRLNYIYFHKTQKIVHTTATILTRDLTALPACPVCTTFDPNFHSEVRAFGGSSTSVRKLQWLIQHKGMIFYLREYPDKHPFQPAGRLIVPTLQKSSPPIVTLLVTRQNQIANKNKHRGASIQHCLMGNLREKWIQLLSTYHSFLLISIA